MKKQFSIIINVILLISLCACGAITEDNNSEPSSDAELGNKNEPYGTTFVNGSIADINVEINEDDWNDMKENAKDEEYHSANITVNQQRFTMLDSELKASAHCKLLQTATATDSDSK